MIKKGCNFHPCYFFKKRIDKITLEKFKLITIMKLFFKSDNYFCFLLIKSFQQNEKPTRNYGLNLFVQCHYHYRENAIQRALETPQKEYFGYKTFHTLDKSKKWKIKLLHS